MSAALRSIVLLSPMLFCASVSHGQVQVRIGVLGLFHPSQLVLESAYDQAIAVTATGAARVLNGEVDRKRIVFRAQGDQVLVGDQSATRWEASARDGSAVRFQLVVPGKIHRTYQGRLMVTAHRGELLAVVQMDIESAVLSIVAAEMPLNAPPEALKAQAVVARSFLASGGRHEGYDFCDTTHCQFLRSPTDADRRVLEAVRATRGSVLTFHDKVLAAMYGSRCGGSTQALRDLGMKPGDGYPYFAVACTWCRQHPVHWQSKLPAVTPPLPGNEPARIALARQWGWSAVPGSSFTVEKDVHGMLLIGHSVGHSLGMCQYGAMGMAVAGADFRAILAHYYPNTEIREVH